MIIRKRITRHDEIAELNQHLLAGLEIYLRRNESMFRKAKTKRFSADDLKSRLNSLIEEAERAHIGQPAIMSVLQNTLDNMKYVSLMGARSSYHTTSTISAPPSQSTVEQIANFIRGN